MNYWELFDLKTDPHELKSVYDDPAYKDVQKDLHQQLYDLRVKLKDNGPDAPSTIIPAKNGAKAERGKPLNTWVLEYKFDKSSTDKVLDATGKRGPGIFKGVKIVEGHNGSAAANFDGHAYIDVPKVKSLNPAVGEWTVEAIIKSDKPDGVILAQGGASMGYNLWLEDGKLRFTVVGTGTRSEAKSNTAVTGQWVKVRAGFDSSNVWLSVNGETAKNLRLLKLSTASPPMACRSGPIWAARCSEMNIRTSRG